MRKTSWNAINKYESNDDFDKAACVTMIWTCDTEITKVINSALIVDAVKTYSLPREPFRFYFNVLKENGVSYKKVLKQSIKYMRLLNTFLVDIGSTYNTEARKTYRGIHKSIMQNVEPNKTFRIINWV